MGRDSIRVAIVERAKTVAGLKDVLPYPPELAPQVVPIAWLGEGTIDIGMAGSEVERWDHELPLTVAVAQRKQSYPQEVAGADVLIYAVVAAFRQSVTLNGQIYGFRYGRITTGPIPFSEPGQFVGFTIPLLLKEKFNVTYTT